MLRRRKHCFQQLLELLKFENLINVRENIRNLSTIMLPSQNITARLLIPRSRWSNRAWIVRLGVMTKQISRLRPPHYLHCLVHTPVTGFHGRWMEISPILSSSNARGIVERDYHRHFRRAALCTGQQGNVGVCNDYVDDQNGSGHRYAPCCYLQFYRAPC